MYEPIEQEYICTFCGKSCNVFQESFDYAGTHCTNGRGGTQQAELRSACCEEEVIAVDPIQDILYELS